MWLKPRHGRVQTQLNTTYNAGANPKMYSISKRISLVCQTTIEHPEKPIPKKMWIKKMNHCHVDHIETFNEHPTIFPNNSFTLACQNKLAQPNRYKFLPTRKLEKHSHEIEHY